MNTRARKILFLCMVFVSGFLVHAHSQEVPGNVRPFVALGYEVAIEHYRNPVIANNRVVSYGELASRKIGKFTLGSGTIINEDGLILTNYHVYDFREQIEYNAPTNQLMRFVPASRDMLVYELSDNDPLKEPVLRYIATPLAFDAGLDVCILKITMDARTGKEVKKKDFPYIKLGNPFAIKLNSDLGILGYPAKGGKTLTITSGKFLGYTHGAEFALDGSIKTNAPIAGGNSGGSALFRKRLIGVPTRVSLKSRKGFDFGYIHPVTWAAGSLAIAKILYGEDIPRISKKWVTSDYNVDITRTHVFVGGKIYSAQSRTPVEGARVLVYRPDRTLDQVIDLDREIQYYSLVYILQKIFMQGSTAADIAALYDITTDEVQKILDVDLSAISISDDARKYAKGEFFYEFREANDKGFFIVAVPREQRFSLHVEKDGFRKLGKGFTSNDALYQDLGIVKIFQY